MVETEEYYLPVCGAGGDAAAHGPAAERRMVSRSNTNTRADSMVMTRRRPDEAARRLVPKRTQGTRISAAAPAGKSSEAVPVRPRRWRNGRMEGWMMRCLGSSPPTAT